MTITTTDNTNQASTDGYTSDPSTPRTVVKNLGRHISDSSTSLDEGSRTESIHTLSLQKFKNLSENDITKVFSPRTILNERRASNTKPLFSNAQVEVSLERKFPSRRARHQLSLEGLSKDLLDIENYNKMEPIKKSKAKVFNRQILSLLTDAVEVDSFQTIQLEAVDTVIANIVNASVKQFLTYKIDLSTYTYLNFQTVSLKIAHEIYSNLVNKDPLYKALPLKDNLFHFKVLLGRRILKQKIRNRSEWLDQLVTSLQKGVDIEQTRGFTFYQSEAVTNHFTQFINIIRQDKFDDDIYSLFLKMIHPDHSVAENVINRCLYWMTVKSLPQLVLIVKSSLEVYLNHHAIQTRTFAFQDEILNITHKLTQVDQAQVARSYLMGNQLNYDVLQINGVDVEVNNLEGQEISSQKPFFTHFFRMLYNSGLYREASEEFISEEVEKFLLRKEKFIGEKIIFLGSISAWAICNEKVRTLFPLFFSSPYNTRLQQGTKCYIQVESEKKYSLLIQKNYRTYALLDPMNVNSFAIDDKKPLIHLQICWQINYKSQEFLSYSISTPTVEQLYADDNEFKTLLELLMIPFPIPNVEMIFPQKMIDSI
jgi:hypothetical protein